MVISAYNLFLELMSAEKYPSIFSRQMATIVYIYPKNVHSPDLNSSSFLFFLSLFFFLCLALSHISFSPKEKFT